MTNDNIERVRQQIMRFHELLDVTQARLDEQRRDYEALFASLPVDAIAGLREKDAQWKLAEAMLDDTTPLQKAVLRARFDCRELMHAYDELHGIILTANDD